MSSVMSHILTHLSPPLQATALTVGCLGFNTVRYGRRLVFQWMSHQRHRRLNAFNYILRVINAIKWIYVNFVHHLSVQIESVIG